MNNSKLNSFLKDGTFSAKLFYGTNERMFGRTDEFQKSELFAFEPWYICASEAPTFRCQDIPLNMQKKLSRERHDSGSEEGSRIL